MCRKETRQDVHSIVTLKIVMGCPQPCLTSSQVVKNSVESFFLQNVMHLIVVAVDAIQ